MNHSSLTDSFQSASAKEYSIFIVLWIPVWAFEDCMLETSITCQSLLSQPPLTGLSAIISRVTCRQHWGAGSEVVFKDAIWIWKFLWQHSASREVHFVPSWDAWKCIFNCLTPKDHNLSTQQNPLSPLYSHNTPASRFNYWTWACNFLSSLAAPSLQEAKSSLTRGIAYVWFKIQHMMSTSIWVFIGSLVLYKQLPLKLQKQQSPFRESHFYLKPLQTPMPPPNNTPLNLVRFSHTH